MDSVRLTGDFRIKRLSVPLKRLQPKQYGVQQKRTAIRQKMPSRNSDTADSVYYRKERVVMTTQKQFKGAGNSNSPPKCCVNEPTKEECMARTVDGNRMETSKFGTKHKSFYELSRSEYIAQSNSNAHWETKYCNPPKPRENTWPKSLLPVSVSPKGSYGKKERIKSENKSQYFNLNPNNPKKEDSSYPQANISHAYEVDSSYPGVNNAQENKGESTVARVNVNVNVNDSSSQERLESSYVSNIDKQNTLPEKAADYCINSDMSSKDKIAFVAAIDLSSKAQQHGSKDGTMYRTCPVYDWHQTENGTKTNATTVSNRTKEETPPSDLEEGQNNVSTHRFGQTLADYEDANTNQELDKIGKTSFVRLTDQASYPGNRSPIADQGTLDTISLVNKRYANNMPSVEKPVSSNCHREEHTQSYMHSEGQGDLEYSQSSQQNIYSIPTHRLSESEEHQDNKDIQTVTDPMSSGGKISNRDGMLSKDQCYRQTHTVSDKSRNDLKDSTNVPSYHGNDQSHTHTNFVENGTFRPPGTRTNSDGGKTERQKDLRDVDVSGGQLAPCIASGILSVLYKDAKLSGCLFQNLLTDVGDVLKTKHVSISAPGSDNSPEIALRMKFTKNKVRKIVSDDLPDFVQLDYLSMIEKGQIATDTLCCVTNYTKYAGMVDMETACKDKNANWFAGNTDEDLDFNHMNIHAVPEKSQTSSTDLAGNVLENHGLQQVYSPEVENRINKNRMEVLTVAGKEATDEAPPLVIQSVRSLSASYYHGQSDDVTENGDNHQSPSPPSSPFSQLVSPLFEEKSMITKDIHMKYDDRDMVDTLSDPLQGNLITPDDDLIKDTYNVECADPPYTDSYDYNSEIISGFGDCEQLIEGEKSRGLSGEPPVLLNMISNPNEKCSESSLGLTDDESKSVSQSGESATNLGLDSVVTRLRSRVRGIPKNYEDSYLDSEPSTPDYTAPALSTDSDDSEFRPKKVPIKKRPFKKSFQRTRAQKISSSNRLNSPKKRYNLVKSHRNPSRLDKIKSQFLRTRSMKQVPIIKTFNLRKRSKTSGATSELVLPTLCRPLKKRDRFNSRERLITEDTEHKSPVDQLPGTERAEVKLKTTATAIAQTDETLTAQQDADENKLPKQIAKKRKRSDSTSSSRKQKKGKPPSAEPDGEAYTARLASDLPNYNWLENKIYQLQHSGISTPDRCTENGGDISPSKDNVAESANLANAPVSSSACIPLTECIALSELSDSNKTLVSTSSDPASSPSSRNITGSDSVAPDVKGMIHTSALSSVTVTPAVTSVLLVATVMPMPSAKPTNFTLCHTSSGSSCKPHTSSGSQCKPKGEISRHMMVEQVPRRNDQPLAVPAQNQRILPKTPVIDSIKTIVTSSLSSTVTSNASITSGTCLSTADTLQKVSSFIPLDFSMKKRTGVPPVDQEVGSPIPSVINIEPEVSSKDRIDTTFLLDLSKPESRENNEISRDSDKVCDGYHSKDPETQDQQELPEINVNSAQKGGVYPETHKSNDEPPPQETETLDLTVQKTLNSTTNQDYTRHNATPSGQNKTNEKVEIDLTVMNDDDVFDKSNKDKSEDHSGEMQVSLQSKYSSFHPPNSHHAASAREKTVFQEVRDTIRENIAERQMVTNEPPSDYPGFTSQNEIPPRIVREFHWINQLVEKTERNLRQLYDKQRSISHDMRVKYGAIFDRETQEMLIGHRSERRRERSLHRCRSSKPPQQTFAVPLPQNSRDLPQKMPEFVSHRPSSAPDKHAPDVNHREPMYGRGHRVEPYSSRNIAQIPASDAFHSVPSSHQVVSQHPERPSHQMNNTASMHQAAQQHTPPKQMEYRVPHEKGPYPVRRISDQQYSYNEGPQRVLYEEERPPPPYQNVPHGTHVVPNQRVPLPMLETVTQSNIAPLVHDEHHPQNIHGSQHLEGSLTSHNTTPPGQVVRRQMQYQASVNPGHERLQHYPSIQRQLNHPPQVQEPVAFQGPAVERQREYPVRVVPQVGHPHAPMVHSGQQRQQLQDMSKPPQLQYQHRPVTNPGFQIPASTEERGPKRAPCVPTRHVAHPPSNKHPLPQHTYQQNYSQQQASRYSEQGQTRYVPPQRIQPSVPSVPYSAQTQLAQPIPQRRILAKPAAPQMPARIPTRKQTDDNKKGSCAVCGASAVYLCSGCKNTWYCTRECQSNAWDSHRMVCL